MTVSAENSYSGPFIGNASTVAFPFTFKALATGEVSVEVDGAAISSSLYDVTLSDDDGGTVTFDTAPAVDTEIYIVSNPDFTQEIDIEDNGAFLQEVIEQAFDRAAVRDIYLLDRLNAIFPQTSFLPSADLAAMFPSWDAEGNPVLSSGTGGGDTALRTDLAATTGAGLVGWIRSATGAISRSVAGVLKDRVSALDFIPVTLHAGIADRTGTTTLTAYIQAAIDAVPAGAALYFPAGTYRMATAVSTTRSVTIVGDPSRENFDNSWDTGTCGTCFDYRGTTGDAFTFAAPDAANSRVNVCLRDFTVRGSRVSASGTTGNCITINGRNQSATFVRLDMSNVHCCEAPYRGLSITGMVYGGTINNCFFHSCGRNGFGADEGGTFVGEMVMGRVRCFSNGQTAGTAQQRANFLYLGGSLDIDMLSATEGADDGVILGGGPIHIGTLQCESNAADQVVLGQSGASAQVTIDNFLIDPGASYTGKHIHMTADTTRAVLGNGYFSNTLSGAGTHITRDVNAGELTFLTPPRSQVAFLMDDNALAFATHQICQVWARNGTAATDCTGDGTEVDFVLDAEVLDTHAAFVASTGIFTAKVSGLYDIEVAIPLQQLGAGHDRGDLKFVATSYSRTYRVGNVGAMRDANNQFTIRGTARVPMVQGDTLKVVFSVGGSTKTVDVIGDALFGFLSICTAH